MTIASNDESTGLSPLFKSEDLEGLGRPGNEAKSILLARVILLILFPDDTVRGNGID